MLKTGAQYLEGLRDGRVVYIGGERIADVTTHPAFCNSARTVAGLYDRKHGGERAQELSYEEDGERHSAWFLRARTRDDLVRRMRAHKQIADATYGLFGRSPDHVTSFVTGLAMQPEVFEPGDAQQRGFASNLLAYYRHARARDLFLAYAVLPPQGSRDPAYSQRKHYRSPALRVTAEDADGVTLNGTKMLATGGILADELWIGNTQPLHPEQKDQAITCAIPVSAPGVSLWSRKAYAASGTNPFDNPLTTHFDETDAIVICEDVKVPWSRVFVHGDTVLSREIYYRTPSHTFGNHQSNVRSLAKLQLLVALASRVTQVNNTDGIPVVRDTLGRLAAQEAALAAMIHGQCMDHEDLGNGYVCFNRRYMYGALHWCMENFAPLCDTVRDLMGGGMFMMPADVSVMEDDKLRATFEDWWETSTHSALDRMKVLRAAWDLVGSEFGSRHVQYEKFYAGPPYVVRSHNFRECPWDALHAIVDDLSRRYQVLPEGSPAAKRRAGA